VQHAAHALATCGASQICRKFMRVIQNAARVAYWDGIDAAATPLCRFSATEFERIC